MGIVNYLKKVRDAYLINQVKGIDLPDFEPSTIVRKKLIFTGRVQKVGFRLETSELAKRLDLTGWVKNRDDKDVEAEIQGENKKIIFLVKHLESLKRASLNNVEINEIPIVNDDIGFTVIRK